MKRTSTLTALAGLLALISSGAQALLLEEAEFTPGNSYTTTFNFRGWSAFDTLEVFIVDDPNGHGPFKYTGVVLDDELAYPLPDQYYGDILSPTYSRVEGDIADGNGAFSLSFEGDPIGQVTLDIVTWVNGIGGTVGTLTGRLWLTDGRMTGWTWLGGNDPYQGYDRSRVPEPGTLALVALGLLAAGVTRRRR